MASFLQKVTPAGFALALRDLGVQGSRLDHSILLAIFAEGLCGPTPGAWSLSV